MADFNLDAFLQANGDEIRKNRWGRPHLMEHYGLTERQARQVLKALGVQGKGGPRGTPTLQPNPTGATPETVRDPKDLVLFDREHGMVYTYLGRDYGTHRLTLDQYSQLIKDYSFEWAGTTLNQDQIAVKYGFPTAHAVAVFLRLHAIRHTSVPFTQWEMEGMSPEEAANQASVAWKQQFLEKSRQQRDLQIRQSAIKWDTLEASIQQLLDAQQARALPAVPPAPLSVKQGDYALIVAPRDLHAGKVAYQSGQRVYSQQEAYNRLMRVSADLAGQVTCFGAPEVIYYVFGSDGVHVDNPHQTTTRGTPQVADGAWLEIVGGYVDVAISNILFWSQVAPVKLIVEPGNHDHVTITLLGLMLEREFRNHPRVHVIRNTSEPRIYTNYGENTLMFAHGDGLKEKEVPRLFLAEAQLQDTPLKANKIAITGDKHHDYQKDMGGCEFIIVPSLAPTDQWHKQSLYVGSKEQAAVYLIDRTHGKRGVLYSRASMPA